MLIATFGVIRDTTPVVERRSIGVRSLEESERITSKHQKEKRDIHPGLPAHVQFTLEESEVPGIEVQRYESSHNDSIFGTFFETLGQPQLKELAFLLKNYSGEQILTFTIRWSYVDSSGNAKVVLQKSPRLHLGRDAIEPKADVLIWPDGHIPSSVVKTGFLLFNLMSSRSAQIMSSERATASVDAVVFTNGEIYGKNESDIQKWLESRKTAAHILAEAVRNANALGENPRRILSDLLRSAKDDQVGEWMRRLGSQKRAETDQYWIDMSNTELPSFQKK
jgi:hypothetical protein